MVQRGYNLPYDHKHSDPPVYVKLQIGAIKLHTQPKKPEKHGPASAAVQWDEELRFFVPDVRSLTLQVEVKEDHRVTRNKALLAGTIALSTTTDGAAHSETVQTGSAYVTLHLQLVPPKPKAPAHAELQAGQAQLEQLKERLSETRVARQRQQNRIAELEQNEPTAELQLLREQERVSARQLEEQSQQITQLQQRIDTLVTLLQQSSVLSRSPSTPSTASIWTTTGPDADLAISPQTPSSNGSPLAEQNALNFKPQSGKEPRKPQKMVQPLRVVIAGGGPCGLILATLLAEYFGPENINIRVFEPRWKRGASGLVEWKGEDEGNRRREQVVTLQDDVTSMLSDRTRDVLFRCVDEVVWRWSRNIHVREVEDRMLERVQEADVSGCIELHPGRRVDAALLQELRGSFDALVGADGGTSFVRSLFRTESVDTRVGTELALGIAFKRRAGDVPPLTQAVNVLLTVGQTRYLLNSHKGSEGFLNMRLVQSEYDECVTVAGDRCQFGAPGFVFDTYATELPADHPRRQRQFRPQRENSQFWRDICQGLELFQIPLHAVTAISAIQINLVYVTRFAQPLKFPEEKGEESADTQLRAAEAAAPMVFVVGDAAFRVHFWPGRGLNSAIKGAVALARDMYWVRRKNFAWLPGSFNGYEGFMQQLRMREQEGRSVPICEQLIRTGLRKGVEAQANHSDSREAWRQTLSGWRDALESGRGWPHTHDPITDKDIDAALGRLHNRTINILHYSGPWPQARGDEVAQLQPDPITTE